MAEAFKNLLSSEVMLLLGRLYRSNLERTRATLDFYKLLYDLPVIKKEYKVTKELFRYCKRRNFFLTILAFNNNQVFLKRSFGENLKWELPGGSIRSRGEESFEDATSRIIERDIPKIEISELTPIAYIEKKYFYEDQFVEHYGLSVMGRVRSPSPTEIEKNEAIKGRFVGLGNREELNRLLRLDRELVAIGSDFLKDVDLTHIESIESEIDSSKQIPRVNTFLHNRIIRPLLRPYSSDRIKRKILSYVKEDYHVLDIACGDDDFIYTLAHISKLCVGNDITWSSIKKIASKSKAISNLLFTNHDACNLPFSKKFDLTLCKNLLHHMSSAEELESLFNSLKKVSNRILIVDPEDPRNNVLSRLWNFYYRVFLRDQGERFYSQDFLNNLLSEYFGAENIKKDKVLTIKGYFMFFHINLSPSIDLQKSNKTDRVGTKAIIFDLDGLLVDTEPIFLRAIKNALLKIKVDVSDKDYIDHDLQNGSSIFNMLLSKGHIKNRDQLREIENECYNNYRKLLLKGFRPMPGAVESIKRLKLQYRLAVASSSRKEFIELILSKLNLLQSFEVIISREDVQDIKPSPECLLKAAAKLKIDVNECILVEDSMRGVRSAEKAKMRVIVIPNELTNQITYNNVLVLPSLNELTSKIIENLD